jgi:hypothetical protein
LICPSSSSISSIVGSILLPQSGLEKEMPL